MQGRGASVRCSVLHGGAGPGVQCTQPSEVTPTVTFTYTADAKLGAFTRRLVLRDRRLMCFQARCVPYAAPGSRCTAEAGQAVQLSAAGRCLPVPLHPLTRFLTSYTLNSGVSHGTGTGVMLVSRAFREGVSRVTGRGMCVLQSESSTHC